MFENCKLKYVKEVDGSNCAVQVNHQDGSGKFMSIPMDTDNTDYQKIQQWIENGGTVIDNGAE